MSFYVLLILFFLLNFFCLLIFSKLSNKIGLIDKPNDRKIHINNVPTVGGISILISVWILFFFLNGNNYEINVTFLILSTSLFLIGLSDDIYDLNPFIRLFISCLLIFIFVFIEKNLLITQLNFQYLGSVNFSKYFSYIFTVLCFALYINSMNMIDGQNGLSGSLFASVIIFLIFKNQELFFHKEILIFILISIFIFLFFNFAGKVFLGDNGIYFISSLIACYLIQTHNKFLISADEIFLILIVPGMDMLRLFVYRIANKQNPFKADNNHLHHILIRRFGETKSLITIIILNVHGIILTSVTSIPIFFVIIFSILVYFLTLNLNRKFIIE